MSDLVAPDRGLTDAVSATTGGGQVALLPTWNGCDKATWLPSDVEPTAPVNIEWFRRPGRFGLDLRIFGPGLADGLAEVCFARRLALVLKSPLLFSDCDINPWSYLMAREDGAILHVYLRASEDDLYDLDPNCSEEYAQVLFSGEQNLPIRHTRNKYSADNPPEQCIIFSDSCPKDPILCRRSK